MNKRERRLRHCGTSPSLESSASQNVLEWIECERNPVVRVLRCSEHEVHEDLEPSQDKERWMEFVEVDRNRGPVGRSESSSAALWDGEMSGRRKSHAAIDRPRDRIAESGRPTSFAAIPARSTDR